MIIVSGLFLPGQPPPSIQQPWVNMPYSTYLPEHMGSIVLTPPGPFVAGSHAGPWYMPRSFVAGTPMVFEDGDLEEVPEIEADRSKFPIIAWDLAPGDAVAFSMLTLHCAAGSATLRRAFSLRLVGDDVTYAPRPHRTSPPFPGLDDELAAGAPLAAPRFPVIWQRG